MTQPFALNETRYLYESVEAIGNGTSRVVRSEVDPSGGRVTTVTRVRHNPYAHRLLDLSPPSDNALFMPPALVPTRWPDPTCTTTAGFGSAPSHPLSPQCAVSTRATPLQDSLHPRGHSTGAADTPATTGLSRTPSSVALVVEANHTLTSTPQSVVCAMTPQDLNCSWQLEQQCRARETVTALLQSVMEELEGPWWREWTSPIESADAAAVRAEMEMLLASSGLECQAWMPCALCPTLSSAQILGEVKARLARTEFAGVLSKKSDLFVPWEGVVEEFIGTPSFCYLVDEKRGHALPRHVSLNESRIQTCLGRVDSWLVAASDAAVGQVVARQLVDHPANALVQLLCALHRCGSLEPANAPLRKVTTLNLLKRAVVCLFAQKPIFAHVSVGRLSRWLFRPLCFLLCLDACAQPSDPLPAPTAADMDAAITAIRLELGNGSVSRPSLGHEPAVIVAALEPCLVSRLEQWAAVHGH